VFSETVNKGTTISKVMPKNRPGPAGAYKLLSYVVKKTQN